MSVVRLQTCLTEILGFLEKFRGGLEQDIEDESEEDREDEEGDGKRVEGTEKKARLQNLFPPGGGPIKGLAWQKHLLIQGSTSPNLIIELQG
ncbi:hypothetical protein Tco_0998254 [Tanacetum coccineum]